VQFGGVAGEIVVCSLSKSERRTGCVKKAAAVSLSGGLFEFGFLNRVKKGRAAAFQKPFY
jgi:hypothetical protein